MVARPLTAVIVVCCLTLAALPPGVADADTTDAAPAAVEGGGPFAQSEVPADDVALHAALAPNGTAHWTVTLRVTFDDESSARAFANVSERIQQSPGTWRTRFGDRMRATAATAQNATNREMTVRNVTIETRTQSGLGTTDYGVVRYTFVWEGFAARDGDRLVAGDAIAGIYLDANTSLAVSWPDGYEPSDVAPAPPDTRNEQTVVWEGERDFGPNEPRVVVAPTGALSELPLSTGAVAVGVLAVGALAVGLAWRAGALSRIRPAGTTPAAPQPEGGGTDAEATPAGVESPTAPTERSDGADGGLSAAATATTAAGGGTESEPPEELLSNEERVLRALRANEGRMKQQDLVSELGWTEAKTSQVVSAMRDEGTIEGFRLGRENVLSLPEDGGQEP